VSRILGENGGASRINKSQRNGSIQQLLSPVSFVTNQVTCDLLRDDAQAFAKLTGTEHHISG
jgi:hypothetical protein